MRIRNVRDAVGGVLGGMLLARGDWVRGFGGWGGAIVESRVE